MRYQPKMGYQPKHGITAKNMGYQPKHGIPSILRCYFTNKVVILVKRWTPGKRWDFRKNMVYQ
jgi:hypothetical protein